MLLSALVSPLVCVVLLNVTILQVACDEHTWYLVQSPFGVFAPGYNLPMMLDFLVEELQSCVNCFCPVGEGTSGTTW